MDEKKRKFLKISAAGGAVAMFVPQLFLGCLSNALTPEDKKADIVLVGNSGIDATELARFYKESDSYGKLTAGENIRIEMVDNGEKMPATISLAGGSPLITYGSGKGAQSAALVFSGLSLKLVDNEGNAVKGDNGKDASAGLFSPRDFSPFLKYGLESGILKTEDMLKLWRLVSGYKKLKEKAENALAPALSRATEELKGAKGELLDKIF